MQPQALQLRDIHLPETIGWWPPALGWWLLALIIPLCCWLIIWLFKRITRKTAVKTAKKLFLALKQNTELNDRDRLSKLSELIRRVAISQSPRAETASLTGQAWLKYLDNSVKGTPFSQGVGQVLANAHFQKPADTDLNITAVTQLCETWLKAQK